MSRAVLFDTETTGLDPRGGDRVIEIAALELLGDLPTGRRYHVLLDPERDVPAEATRVHGFTREMLVGRKRFAEVAAELLAFLGDGRLIAHNAPFDFGFLDAEFDRIGLPPLDPARMVDTYALARTRFPGMPNSLDALCRRYDVDLSERTTHNALLDCRLLAEVYVELTGGRQRGLELVVAAGTGPTMSLPDPARRPRRIANTVAELAAHAAYVATLADPIWLRP